MLIFDQRLTISTLFFKDFSRETLVFEKQWQTVASDFQQHGFRVRCLEKMEVLDTEAPEKEYRLGLGWA